MYFAVKIKKMTTILRIVFRDETDSRKLRLDCGIPDSVEDLQEIIKRKFEVEENFRLQYFDNDFEAYMNLTSVSEIGPKSTIKIIFLSMEEEFITLFPVETSTLATESTSEVSERPQTPISSVMSSCSDDTLVTTTPVSSPEFTSTGYSSWPQVFVIPKFTYEAELELQQKNAEFEAEGKYFTPGPKLKTVILEFLAQEMLKYTKYPKDYQCEEVAEALTRTHPCLSQLGSRSGFWGWKQSLKYKMQNYRTKLGRLGHPEVLVNSLRHKREGNGKVAANIKKPRKAEINYIPLYPKAVSLLEIFKPKGGSKGQRIKRLLELSEAYHNDVDVRREYILKCLMVYLNEDPISLFKDYSISEVSEAENDVPETVMGIFIFRRSQHGLVDDIWIVIEGVKRGQNFMGTDQDGGGGCARSGRCCAHFTKVV
ncbi:hypothetical protein WMY93_000621 [Mugilogobius chulae]|uniref:PB1 domain-containing protein n=1 Tax=Mugilogobius chulae TaxID=88201 RepID=A0AAW0Q1F1_9GOBI